MVERHSGFVNQVGGVGVVNVEDHRLAQSALWTPSGNITSRSGMVPNSAAVSAPGTVKAISPTPTGHVTVDPFRYVLQSGRGGGIYALTLDAIKDINVLGDQAADPSNARNDLIVAQQSDTYFSDANSDMVVRHVIGTPSGAPVDPPVTGSSDYVILARVVVPANATSIVTANITNFAIPWSVSTGGIVPVRTQAERDALVPWEGMKCYRVDKGWNEDYIAGAWRVPNGTLVSSLADVTNPAAQQFVRLTGDRLLYEWSGTAWLPLNVARAARCRVNLPGGSFAQAATDVGAAGGWAAVSGEDPLGMFSTVSSRAQILIPTGYGGRYFVSMNIYFSNATGFAVATMTKNTTALTTGAILRIPAVAAGGDGSRCQFSTEVPLAAGDVLRWVTYASVACNCGGSVFGVTGSDVYIRRVAEV